VTALVIAICVAFVSLVVRDTVLRLHGAKASAEQEELSARIAKLEAGVASHGKKLELVEPRVSHLEARKVERR
jgi:BMFP domain-containing protein YqiC